MEYSLLQDLCKIHAVTGDTKEIEDYLVEKLKALNIQPVQLGYGTIVFGNTQSPKKLISAHIDEVGFQVTKIEDNGKIRILPIGWVFANRLDHCIVYIKTDTTYVRGLVIHEEELKTENLTAFQSLFIDIGANTKQEVIDKGIRVGQTGSFQKEYWENNGSILASSLDNKISVFIILDLIKNNPELLNDNLFSFVTDEEMFDHSANGLGAVFKPDLAVVLDYCPVHQRLGDGDQLGEVNKGPVVMYRGGSYILHQDVRHYFDTKISSHFQKGFISSSTLPQLEPVNFQNNGYTKAVNVCLPAYAYHGSAYSIRRSDVEALRNLVGEILKTPF